MVRIFGFLFAVTLLCGCNKHKVELEQNRLALSLAKSNEVVAEAQWLANSNREAEALAKMMPEITNSVIGLRTIIDYGVSAPDDNVSNWSGVAEVEYINHLGGVDRTNLSFCFREERYSWSVSTNRFLMCYERVDGSPK